MANSVKVEVVEELRGIFSRAKSAVVANYQGIDAEGITALRVHMRSRSVDFRVDKAGTVHAQVGKASFPAEDLAENYNALMAELIRLKPSSSKGKYVRAVSLSSTMGAGIRVAFVSS